MRPRNEAARDRLDTVLARRAAVSAPELAAQLEVSVPTLHRMLPELGERLVVAGKARRTRYALRRPLRGELAEWPVYEVDEAGRASLMGPLALVCPQGSRMPLAEAGWPVPPESLDGWWDGLPYPLHDMRPQGYMGRQFARLAHREFNVAANPDAWSDDDTVHVLSRVGADASGSLILGDAAFARWQAGKLAPAEPLRERGLGKAYAALAGQAVAAGVPGSSAAGEFPKFAAVRELAGRATPHVLVKFSGADDSPAVRRWADLLVSEHLALEALSDLPGLHRARSRVLTHAGRTFLEVERFDRHGEAGRSRLTSLATLDAALLGDGSSDWAHLARRFAREDLLSDAEALQVERLWWFGRLIGNTDMHTGNLSFRAREGRLTLAPAYDMLPMLYAPLPGGELPQRRFEPPLPLPAQRGAWEAACAAALRFWRDAGADRRVSEPFRQTAQANEAMLQRTAERL